MPELVRQVEWDHMHKWKYFMYNSSFMFSLEAVFYPAAVVRTRLQIQRTDKLYKSTLDAFAKIAKLEGIRGLYRGFLVAQLGIITGGVYFTTYEVTRKKLSSLDEASRGFAAGFTAAIVEQCVGNPLQVVTQKRMLEGQTPGQTRLRGAGRIVLDVYKRHGPKGLYRGFLASLFAMGLDSAMWWACYGVFLEAIGYNVPEGASHLVVQATAGALSGFATTVIGNPLDVIKTRLQVHALQSSRLFVNL
jgi:hypothetical protein